MMPQIRQNYNDPLKSNSNRLSKNLSYSIVIFSKETSFKPILLPVKYFFAFFVIFLLSLGGYIHGISIILSEFKQQYFIQSEWRKKKYLEEGTVLLDQYLAISIHRFYSWENTSTLYPSEYKINNAFFSLFQNSSSILSGLLNKTLRNLIKSSQNFPQFYPSTKIIQKSPEKISFYCPTLGRISSHFGKRTDPVFEGTAIHKGIDIATNVGSAVNAASDGTILFSGSRLRWGNVIIIDHHNTGYQTIYAHLSATVVSKGNQVIAGQLIGFVGNTGKSTGPHLHYEVRYNGKAIDPLLFLLPADSIAD